MIITSRQDRPAFKKLLKNGEQFGISIKYGVQKNRKGIADALIIAERFIKNDSVMLALGDNIFHGTEMTELLAECIGGD